MANDPPKGPPAVPPPSRPATILQVSFEKTRWRVHHDGRDFGPFGADEMLKRIQSHEFDADTQVYEQWSDQTCRLGDISQFAQVLEMVRRGDVNEQLKADTRATEEEVRTSARRRWWWTALWGTVVVAVLIYAGDRVLTAVRYPAAQLVHGLYADLALVDLALARAPTQDDDAARPKKLRSRARPSTRKRSTSSSRTPLNLVSTGTKGVLISGAATPTISFDEEEAAESTRPLDRRKLQTELDRVKRPLTRCLQDEALARPEFRGATVTFWFQSNGIPDPVRLGGAGEVSRRLVRCVKRAIHRVRVPAFRDVAQRVSLKIDVNQ